jgi:hypothetical protein
MGCQAGCPTQKKIEEGYDTTVDPAMVEHAKQVHETVGQGSKVACSTPKWVLIDSASRVLGTELGETSNRPLRDESSGH